jgi:hypothetical protein
MRKEVSTRVRDVRRARGVVFLLGTALVYAACGGGEKGAKGGAGDGVIFHASLPAIPGLDADTGLQPAGSPVQLQLTLNAEGESTVDAVGQATGSASAPKLVGKPGSGLVEIEGSFSMVGRLVVDVSGLPSYDGPIPGLDDVEIVFQGSETFDPFLLDGSATAHAAIPSTDLPDIPLPGGLPGSLKLKVGEGSTVDVTFQGSCAAIEGSTAYYTGILSRGGSLVIQPTVELDIPIVGIQSYPLPDMTIPVAVPGEDVDLGPQSVQFGSQSSQGEEAMVGSCGGGSGASGMGGAAGAAGEGGSGSGTGTGGTGGSTGGTGGSTGGTGGSTGGTGGTTGGTGGSTGGTGGSTGGTGGSTGGTGGSTGGTGGTTCWEFDQEPNDSLTSSTSLGSTTDCDLDQLTRQGTLGDVYDEDWYQLSAQDDFGCVVNPRLSISTSDDVYVCAYFQCKAGSTVLDCQGSSFKDVTNSQRPGCCDFLADGAIDASVDCTGTSSDAADVWLSVSSFGLSNPTASCQDYTLTFRY